MDEDQHQELLNNSDYQEAVIGQVKSNDRTVQSYEAWEEQCGFMLCNVEGLDLAQEVDASTFKQVCTFRGVIGVDITFRKGWLVANGHPINRANMLDASLPNSFEQKRLQHLQQVRDAGIEVADNATDAELITILNDL